MAHAIGCLGSATDTYRREKLASKQRAARKEALRRGPIRNQNRKLEIVAIVHEHDTHAKLVKVRKGHVHHLVTAYAFAEIKPVVSQ